MTSQSQEQAQANAQTQAPLVQMPAQNMSDLSSLPLVASSGKASTDESAHVLASHRGPGSLHSGQRRSSSAGSGVPQSASSLSELARQMKAEGVPGSAGDPIASSPGDAPSAQGQGQPIVEVAQGQGDVGERPPPLPVPQGAARTLVSTEQGDGRSTSVVTPPGIEVPLRSPIGRPRSLSPPEEERTPSKRRATEAEFAREKVPVPTGDSFEIEHELGQVMDEDAQSPGVAPEVQHRIQEGHVAADELAVGVHQFMAMSQAKLRTEPVLAPVSNIDPMPLVAPRAQEQTESGDVPMAEHPVDQDRGISRSVECPMSANPQDIAEDSPQFVLQLRARNQAVEAQLAQVIAELQSVKAEAQTYMAQVKNLILERDDLSMQIEDCSALAERRVKLAET